MDARQLVRMIPEQILASRVLRMSIAELQTFVEEQVLENPALVVDDRHRCPLCGAPASSAGACAVCGFVSDPASQRTREESDAYASLPTPDVWESLDDDAHDPFGSIAAETGLSEYLHRQAAIVFEGDDRIVADYIIDSLDERGYFCESLVETASLFGLCVPELRTILDGVQEFDPPGIAATSVQECLLLQLRQVDAPEHLRGLAERIISACWRDLAGLKWKAIAEKLQSSTDDVRAAVRLIGEKLTPYPAALYRPPWQELSPSGVRRIVPDVIIRRASEDDQTGLICDVVDFRLGSLKIDELYRSAYEQIKASRASFSEEERRHICEQVAKARCVLDAVALRRATLARLCLFLAEKQKDFILHGAQKLKPMTQKQVAKQLELHESTVSRAVQNKYVQLPSGEVVPMDRFFDSALPVKEMIARIVAADAGSGRLSDSQIAARLAEEGILVARRTVAKYRAQLQLPPVHLRAA